MAAKTGPSFSMSNEHRVKIQNSNILNALIEHAEGIRDMSSTQVSAALGLLRKIMPDLASTTIAGTLTLVSQEDALSELDGLPAETPHERPEALN